jgi:dTMP kinase
MFIVFEGGEGCGKSTQAKRLESVVAARGKTCLLTREPGGTPLAESIRSLFKQTSMHGDDPTPLAELHLVMAARAQHLEKRVVPALERGDVVVCDRFLDSSYVYQGVRGGLPKEVVDAAARAVLGDLVPTLTLVLDLPAEVAAMRVGARATPLQTSTTDSAPSSPPPSGEDRLDALDAFTYARIAQGFRDLVTTRAPYPGGRTPHRVLIDATGTPDDVFARVLAAYEALDARQPLSHGARAPL